MSKPLPDPHNHTIFSQTTWRGIFTLSAMVAAVPLLLWGVSQPLAGVSVLVTTGGLFITVRHARRLVRCFYDCQGLEFNLGGRVWITIAQTPTHRSD